MKIFIQVVDVKTFIHQYGMIDEPIEKGFEIRNALSHFGVSYGHVKWENKSNSNMFGIIEGTSKVVSVIIPENIAPENILNK